MSSGLGQRDRGMEQVIAHTVSHPTRVRILLLLDDASHTASEIAELLDEPLGNVSNHLRQLLEAGAIEIARTEQKGNLLQHHYTAFELPLTSEQEAAAMTPQQRQATAALVVQSVTAEAMAALSAGTLASPSVCLTWDWFNVDERGRREIVEEQERLWARIQEIEAEARERRAVSGEEAQTIVVSQQAYERARSASR